MKIKTVTYCRYVLLSIFISIALISQGQSQFNIEELRLKNDSIQLPGTLTYAKNLKTQPLVIFVHGSGNVDRNGNQKGLANANYIKQLSEALTKNDIAFYRYDKRTSTPENMKFIMTELVFEKFVEDAEIAVNHFKDDQRFSSITLIGHSQGSLVAMLAITKEVDKYISLAGPAEPIDQKVIEQVQKQNGDSIANIVRDHFKELKVSGTIAKVDPNLMALFNKPNLPFMASWMSYNPVEEIKKINSPTLIINGGKDIQVSRRDAQLLHEAKPDSDLIIVNDMNHVLKTITKDEDQMKSYSSPDFPLSEDLVSTITEFIKN